MKLKKFIKLLEGKKTYAIALCMVLYHLTALILSKEGKQEAFQGLMEAAAFAGLRAAK